MPATATRPRENTAETRDGLNAHGHASPLREVPNDCAAFSRVDLAPASVPERDEIVRDEPGVEWHEVAPLVDQFTNRLPEAERKRRRGLRRRHRSFVMSGVFWVGLLFGIELVGLVYLYSLDLTAVRAAATLDKEIQKTTLDKNLADNQLAASVSPAKLDIWAGQLGYHKAGLTEMDDVTSSVPAAPPTSAEIAQ